jgi:hypothetical protein
MASADNRRKYVSELSSMNSAVVPTCSSEGRVVSSAAGRLRSRTLTCAAPVALLCFVASFAGSVPQKDSNKTWIADVAMISPEKLDHIERGSVLIEDGRIARVERNQDAKMPAGAVTVSGKGQYRIVEKRIGYQPTIQVLSGELAYLDSGYLKLPAISKVTPKEMVQWFPAGQSGRQSN